MKDVFIEMLERVKNDLTTAPDEHSLVTWELRGEDDYTDSGMRYIEQTYINTRLSSSGLGDQLELVAEIGDESMRVRFLGLNDDDIPYAMGMRTINSEDQYDDLMDYIKVYTRR